jgi:hypothetical protein
MSSAKQGVVKAQLDVLREEGSKKPKERDGGAVKEALECVEKTATTVTALGSLWTTYGPTLLSWFS